MRNTPAATGLVAVVCTIGVISLLIEAVFVSLNDGGPFLTILTALSAAPFAGYGAMRWHYRDSEARR